MFFGNFLTDRYHAISHPHLAFLLHKGIQAAFFHPLAEESLPPNSKNLRRPYQKSPLQSQDFDNVCFTVHTRSNVKRKPAQQQYGSTEGWICRVLFGGRKGAVGRERNTTILQTSSNNKGSTWQDSVPKCASRGHSHKISH